MAFKRGKADKYVGKKQQDGYLSAVKEFTQMTIQDPSFFSKSSEEQVSLARATLEKHRSADKQHGMDKEKI